MSTTYAVDSTLTGSRGSPNAASPGSDGHNWANQRGNQTVSFTGTQIKFVYNGSTTLGVWTYSSLSESVIEVLCNVTAGNTSDIAGLVICQSGTSYYYCDIGNISGKVEIGKAPSFTSLVSATFSWSAGTSYTIRFQYGVATSTTLRAKIWQTGTGEPGSWTVSITDSTLSAGGGFGICMAPVNGSSGDLFDTFSATDGATGVALTATLAGAGTLTETFSLATALSDTLAGSGTLAGTLALSTTLTDTLAGVGVLTGTVSLSTALALTLAGAGTLTATPGLATSLTSTLAGSGTLAGTLSLSTALSTTLTGVGTLSGTISTPGSVSLSGTLAGSSALTGSMSATTSLTGSFAGSGMLLATIVATTSLGSTLAGNGSISGSFSLATMLSALFAGVGLISHAQLSLLLPFSVPGIATLSDNLHGSASIQDVLLDQATAGDVAAGSVALSDQA